MRSRRLPGRTHSLCRFLAAVLPALLPGLALAASGGGGGQTEIFSQAYIMQIIGSLLLVFGCLFGLVFLMRKLNGVPVGDRKSMRIVSSVKVGSREKLMLLDIGERQLLLGVAAGSIRTLYVFDGDEPPGQSIGKEHTDFASLLPAGAGPGAAS